MSGSVQGYWDNSLQMGVQPIKIEDGVEIFSFPGVLLTNLQPNSNIPHPSTSNVNFTAIQPGNSVTQTTTVPDKLLSDPSKDISNNPEKETVPVKETKPSNTNVPASKNKKIAIGIGIVAVIATIWLVTKK